MVSETTAHDVPHHQAHEPSPKRVEPHGGYFPNNNIIDIRYETDEGSILDDMLKGLHVKDGEEKRLPTLLLYDEAGLRLFEKITYLEEYYLTNAEIEVLMRYADRIAQRIQPGSIIVELGSG